MKTTALGTILLALSLVPVLPGQCNDDVFDNTNIFGVSNNPSSATTFTISQDTRIESIRTYHWNSGLGDIPGTIGLVDVSTGASVGTWQATGLRDWYAYPDVVLCAGTYRVVDSRPQTWSHNLQSGFRGFADINGCQGSHQLFDNSNIFGVQNGPLNFTEFTLGHDHVIDYVWTYHWNGSQGSTPGVVRLYNTGTGVLYGPFSVTTTGTGGRPQNWHAYPNIRVPAGTYRILASNHATWSHNAQSGFRGFAQVRATPACTVTTAPRTSRVVYPTPSGFELVDRSANMSTHIDFAGVGPQGLLPIDVDASFAPDESLVLYPTPSGIEVLDVSRRTSRRIPYAGNGPTFPLPAGVDVTISHQSDRAVYPTQRGFEVMDLNSQTLRFVPYAGVGPTTPIPFDVDVNLTDDGTQGVYPTRAGFEVINLVTNQSRLVPYAGPGPLSLLPWAVDAIVTRDGLAIYPTGSGFEVLNFAAGVSTFFRYAGVGPIQPLPMDVDVSIAYIGASRLAIYVSRDGFEILNLNAGTVRLARWSGVGPILPLPNSIDAPLTLDRRKAVYPSRDGFEVLDVLAGTTSFARYDGPGPTLPLPLGVDVVMARDSQTAVYPTRGGFEVLNLLTNTSNVIRYDGAGPLNPLPLGVDVVVTADSSRAIYPTGTGFEVLSLPNGPSTFVAYDGPLPLQPLPIDVDPILSLDDRSVFYTTPRGFERLDLGTNLSTYINYDNNGPMTPMPIGVDAQVASQVMRGGQGTLAVYHEDASDEDFLFSIVFGPLFLELITSELYDFQVQVSHVPEGAVSGYTFFSFDTSLPLGEGWFFGLQPDAVSVGSLTAPPAAGNVFNFLNPHTPGVFPMVPWTLPPGALAPMTGLEVDGLVVFLDADGAVLSTSNISRMTIH